MTLEIMLSPAVFYVENSDQYNVVSHFRIGDEDIVPIEKVDNIVLWRKLMSLLKGNHPVPLEVVKQQCEKLQQQDDELDKCISELQKYSIVMIGDDINLGNKLTRWLCQYNLYSNSSISKINSTSVGFCFGATGKDESSISTLIIQGFMDYGFQVQNSDFSNLETKPDVVLVVGDYTDRSIFKRMNKDLYAKNIPWMLVCQSGLNLAQLGPIFLQDKTACYECLSARMFSNRDNPQEFKLFDQEKFVLSTDLWLDWQTKIIADMVADEILRWRLNSSLSSLIGQSKFINTLDWSIDQEKILRTPNCPVCGQLARGV